MDQEAGKRRLGGPGAGWEKSRRGPGIGALLLILLLAAMLLAGGLFAYRALFSGAPGSDGPVTLTVREGETLSSAAGRLEEVGAIGSAMVFELQARLEGLGGELKPGEYRITPDDSNREILTVMTEGEGRPMVEITLPEGLTLEQTARRAAAQSGISESDFRQAAQRTGYGYEFLEEGAARSTEGFLFPKQYEFTEGAEAPRMVDRMLQQYALETEGLDFQQARRELGMSEAQIVTVASLIEREAAGAGERPVIASVIYNRLEEEMPLQIDATVRYALGEQEERLSLQDLEVDSPYNTYETKGLPPGPIASPGLDSIKAALNPADTDYLYYVLDRNGEEHTFTESYEGFLRAKEKTSR